MMPFKKILVPVDFSSHGSEAVRVAADLSRRYDASITLTHVYEPSTAVVPDGFFLYVPEQVEKLKVEHGKLLAKAKQEAEAAGALRVGAHQLQGIASAEIVEFARTGEFDLIVMGTHGRTGLAHALIGSVAERVVRKASCPVLTVKGVEPER